MCICLIHINTYLDVCVLINVRVNNNNKYVFTVFQRFLVDDKCQNQLVSTIMSDITFMWHRVCCSYLDMVNNNK